MMSASANDIRCKELLSHIDATLDVYNGLKDNPAYDNEYGKKALENLERSIIKGRNVLLNYLTKSYVYKLLLTKSFTKKFDKLENDLNTRLQLVQVVSRTIA